jgi:hypothetical protein
MPATYDKIGLRFQYPDNWKLSEDIDEIPRSVVVSSPDGAFWSVDVHPFSVDLDMVLEQMLNAMRTEYDDLETEPHEGEIQGEPTKGHNMAFYCLDFLVACQIRAFKHGHAVYVTTYQAEDRDFDKLKLVFDAITTSMLSEETIS